MPELLIELFSEEIPARMQVRAEADLAKLLLDKLAAAGLEAKAVRTGSGPRRLAFAADLPKASADVREAKKGPRVGAPEQAITGFLRGAGLASLDQARIVEDPKGDFYEAVIERPGRATADIVAEALPAVIVAFPWPKSMRTGTSELRWVRPLQRILCAFDDQPVVVGVEGVDSGVITSGHRFHAPAPFAATRFADYEARLLDARVIVDRGARKTKILDIAKAACAARGLELVEDLGLLDEVAGLVEWPVAVIGDMDPAFLDLPSEVIRLTMRTHQRYFALRDGKTGALAPHFLTMANIEAKDGGAAIAKGNARVLSARLNDARFFWAKDNETPLYTDDRREKLKAIVFHAKLGSVWDKVERVRALAKELAPVVWESVAPPLGPSGHSPRKRGERDSVSSPPFTGEVSAKPTEGGFASLDAFLAAVDEAALNCKMDLVTETVGEFPELQGQIGRQLFNGHASVAAAIEDHYRPLGPNDRVPTDPVAVTLALADKLDTLAAFWAIDEKPTGSSDPFALRRAALGVVRNCLHNDIRFSPPSPPSGGRGQGEGGGHADLRHWILVALSEVLSRSEATQLGAKSLRNFSWRDALYSMPRSAEIETRMTQTFGPEGYQAVVRVVDRGYGLLAFLADRLKVQLRDQGKRHDLVDAVFALGDDDLVRIVARVDALAAFLKTDDGANLLAGFKRATNILAAEDKKGQGVGADWLLDEKRLKEPAEIALNEALSAALPTAASAVQAEDFAAAMSALAKLRAPVDAFFEGVMVNAEDPQTRRNRMLLLKQFGDGVGAVADFSKIEG